MRIPERPSLLQDLDLMIRLKAYSEGEATWFPDGRKLGHRERTACESLHAHLTILIEQCLHPLMDRVTSREMQTFTMHDHAHGLKVAHLMWHILKVSRRPLLTPGEIALLLVSAHLHDLGMGLSPEERVARLHSQSELWERLDAQSPYLEALRGLSELATANVSDSVKADAVFQVQQAQEALLCRDCRERHATAERYREIISSLQAMHKDDAIRIPNPSTMLSFDGDSYEEKLIDICVSHNQDAHELLGRDPQNSDQRRFPTHYPLGCCLTDTRLVAATLRLADILDFDRERTPPVLYHYLLPRSADPSENVSVREWSKHLAISNWEFENRKIVFRGRSSNAFVHHTIVEFCRAIQDEIAQTYSVFGVEDWPFCIEPSVEPIIEASGYRYVPYRFSLDEDRIYALLMGNKIYRSRLDALRELVQNAIDACKLRDALICFHDKSMAPSKEQRIVIRYEERGTGTTSPRVSVIDTGIGMDRYVIENYFLKVGRSYYKSDDFLRKRALLRREGLDFRPVSEFGIGFLSVFMLGDRVEVETAPWFPAPDDTQRRTLRIDGLGRLIELTETQNVALPRFHGTRVSIQLGSRGSQPPSWEEIQTYIRRVCKNLEYPIFLERVIAGEKERFTILPEGLKVEVPVHLTETVLLIPVNDAESGLRGEIAIYRAPESEVAEAALAADSPVRPRVDHPELRARGAGILLRGGFVIGEVPGLPEFVLTAQSDARIEVTKDHDDPNSLPVTDLSRTAILDAGDVASVIFRAWLDTLMRGLEDVETRPIGCPGINWALLRRAGWLERYNAYQLYRLAKTAWVYRFKDIEKARVNIARWESGENGLIYIGSEFGHYLYWEIFSLIMPKITEIVRGREGENYLKPPRKGWIGELENWNTFVKDGLNWGDFANYTSGLEDILCDLYVGSSMINSRYRDRFTEFSHGEIQALFRIFATLLDSRSYGRQASLDPPALKLLERAIDVAGDLSISKIGRKATLGSFSPGRR